MTSIKKSILQKKQEELDKGEGEYKIYKEINDRLLMDSLYLSNKDIDKLENYDKYDKIINEDKRLIPNKEKICDIKEEYKCNNVLTEFDKLKNMNHNEVKEINNKYKKEINDYYVDYNKKYLELKKSNQILMYFNIFIFLLIMLVILTLSIFKLW